MKFNNACRQIFLNGDLATELISDVWTVSLYTGKEVDVGKSVKRKPICRTKTAFKINNLNIITSEDNIEQKKITRDGKLSFARIEKGKYIMQITIGTSKEKNPLYDPRKTKILTFYDGETGVPYEIRDNPDPEYFYIEGELHISNVNVFKGETLIIETIKII